MIVGAVAPPQPALRPPPFLQGRRGYPSRAHQRDAEEAGMEPIPETVQAADELDPVLDADRLLRDLQDKAAEGREIVPDCLGLSLAVNEHEVTFTLMASSLDIAVLDAVQYLAGGPCLDAARSDEVLEFREQEILDEESWRLFAGATAATAVVSTLTLPILDGDRVVGTVNLYGGSANAF